MNVRHPFYSDFYKLDTLDIGKDNLKIQVLIKTPETHWTYWLQILSELCFQRVALSGNYEIVAISTDKNTFLMTLIIKLTLGNIFIKVKNPPGGATVTK